MRNPKAMNDAELKALLKKARTPDRPEEFWDLFPRRVIAAFNRRSSARQTEMRRAPRLAWALAMVTCLVVAGFLGYRHWHAEQDPGLKMLQNAKLIRETLALFPNQVRAIVQDEHGLQVVLSDKPDVPTSTPLWIKVCDGKQCRAFVTFSGQELQLAKEKVEVLMDAQGQVMLVGDRLFWSSAGPDRGSDHLRIQARSLSYAM
jgi:hypothetical protein